MIEAIKSILSNVEFWKIFVPAILVIIAWFINERNKRYWEKWKLKRVACIQALDIANAVLSSYDYKNVKQGDIISEEVSTSKVRKCFNLLACTCDDKKIIDILKKILFDKVSPDIVVDLRSAVREELKFGKKEIDNDRKKAFVGKVSADPKVREIN